MANKLSLRDMAETQGWKTGYSQVPGVDGNNQPFNQGYVSLYNPKTGFTTGFNQGQGIGSGVGEFSGGSHYVTDQDALMKLMNSQMPKTDVASGKAPYEYNRQYLTNDAINNSLSAINKQFNYNPAQDSALHMAQNQAQDTVRKHMARSGMAYSTVAKAKMQESAQSLIPQYEDRAYGKFQDERQNQYQMLSQKAQLEQLNYNEYKDLQNFEIEQYGTVLNPEMRQHMATYNSLTDEMKRDLENTFGKDYHAEINRLRAVDANHHMIPVLEAMRANKVLKDPGTLSKYASQYGIASPKLAERGQDFEVQQKQYTALVQDIQKGEIEKAIMQMEKSQLPDKMKWELLQMAADYELTKANIAGTQVDTAYRRKATSLME